MLLSASRSTALHLTVCRCSSVGLWERVIRTSRATVMTGSILNWRMIVYLQLLLYPRLIKVRTTKSCIIIFNRFVCIVS